MRPRALARLASRVAKHKQTKGQAETFIATAH